MAVIVNGDGILTGISSLATALTDLTSGRGTITGVTTVGTLQLGAGVSMSSPRTQNAAIFTNNTEFLTVDDAGRVGVGTVTPNSDAHPQNVGKINVGFITARSVAGDIDANTMVVAGVSTFTGAVNVTELATFSKSGSALRLNDSSILRLGNDDSDFFLYHDGGTIDYISAGASRQLRLTTDDFIIKGASNTETLMSAAKDGTVVLYHDNTGRLNTDSTGITVTNRITGGGDANTYINVGPNDIIDLYTGGTNLVRMDANGRLGINNNSPTCKLSVTDGASSGDGITEILRLNGSPNDLNDGIKLQFSRVGGASGSITLQKVNNNNTTDMIFGTRSGNTESETMRLKGGGTLQLGGATADASDIDLSNSKLTIKQSANAKEDGIYIERSGERRGFYIYMGGALSTSDSLSITTNQLGGDTDVMAIDRGGDIVVANNIKINTSGKGIDFSATSNGLSGSSDSSELLDDYEEGTWTPLLHGYWSSGWRQMTIASGTIEGATYTKIGRLVFFKMYVNGVTISGNGPGTYARIYGLPYQAANNGYAAVVNVTHSNAFSNTNTGNFYVSPNASDMIGTMYGENNTGYARWSNSSFYIMMSGVYEAT